MKKLLLKLSVVAVALVFLGTSIGGSTFHPQPTSTVSNGGYGNFTPISYGSSSYSVHLFVNNNSRGWIVFSANYTSGGIITFNFDNDRTQNFSTNSVPSGTIFHLVSSPDSGYSFVNWTGSVKSTNNSIYVTVNQNINEEAFYKKTTNYSVKFTESGLPSGNSWYVNLTNGQSFSSTTSTMSFSEPNGTYSYTIGNVSGYTASPSSGSITVSGSNATKTITFTVTSTSSKPSGISSTELYGIIGAVVAVAIIGTALATMRKRR